MGQQLLRILSEKHHTMRPLTELLAGIIGREFMPLIRAYFHVHAILWALDQELLPVLKGDHEGCRFNGHSAAFLSFCFCFLMQLEQGRVPHIKAAI